MTDTLARDIDAYERAMAGNPVLLTEAYQTLRRSMWVTSLEVNQLRAKVQEMVPNRGLELLEGTNK